jgi:hypothetical protein
MDEEKSISEMEAEAEEQSVPAPKETGAEDDNPWAGEERKKDEQSDKDAEPRVKVYTLSVPNKTMRKGEPNKGWRKLCLDKDYAIAPRDIIRCVVLHRQYQKLAQIPYKQGEKVPKDTPWLKYLGYSIDAAKPTPDSTGWYFPRCRCSETECWKQCSIPTVFKDGEVQETPLLDGECPWGRWGNAMTEADRDKYKLTKDDKPLCNNQTVFYCYDLDIMVPFVAYFKVTSLQSASDFLAACSRRIGDEVVEYPFHAFEGQISVQGEDEFFTSHIMNTTKYTKPALIKPLVTWFENNRGIIIRNLAAQMEEAKKRKAKKDAETDFNPEEFEGKK